MAATVAVPHVICIEKTGQAIITRHEIVIRWMMGKVLLAHPLFVVYFSSCFLNRFLWLEGKFGGYRIGQLNSKRSKHHHSTGSLCFTIIFLNEWINSYFLHWNFDWKSCFVVFFHEWNELKNPQFNFFSQDISIERNFFKWGGKVTKILHLLFHRI